MGPSLFTALSVFFLISVCYPTGCNARSEEYYQILREFSEGKDFYSILGIREDASSSETKKAYHKQSLIYHPDKNKDPAAVAIFMGIQRAYEVLSNEEKKADYDKFRKEGIPLHERYYGVYMHEWGAPQHDIRSVVAWLIGIITVAKYLFQWWRHEDMKNRAKQTLRYKKAVKEAKANAAAETSSNGKPPKKNKKKKVSDDSVSEPDIEVQVHGAEMPTWRDLFIVQLAFLPFQPFILGYSVYQNWGIPPRSQDEIWQEKLGLNDEDFAKWKEQQIYKYQQRMNSAKMKRYQRWLRKQ